VWDCHSALLFIWLWALVLTKATVRSKDLTGRYAGAAVQTLKAMHPQL